jgi:hypothetical protein
LTAAAALRLRNPAFVKKPVLGPRKVEVFAQGPAFVFAAEEVAALEFGDHPVDEIVEAARDPREHDGCRLHRPRAKMYAVDAAEPSPPLFRLFYQVEIRCLQFPH